MRWLAACLLCCYSFYLHADYAAILQQKIKENIPSQWALQQLAADFKGISPLDLSQTALNETMQDRRYGGLLRVRYKIEKKELKVLSATECAKTHPRMAVMTKMFKMILEVCRNKNLPCNDCDFILTLEDVYNPLWQTFRSPFLCFSKNRNVSKGILIPDSDVIDSREMLQEKISKGIQHFPWSSKKAMAFWRGASTGVYANYHDSPRYKLVVASLRSPHLIDAKFDRLVQGVERNAKEYAPYVGGWVDVEEHFRYKYQILIDGNSASWTRGYWQLFSNCVMFKVQSNDIQWYYGALQPYVHYIPVAADCSDLITQIQWAKNNDGVAHDISQNGQEFAQDNLTHADLLYYVYLVLRQYADIQRLK